MGSGERQQLSVGPAMASYDEYPREDKHHIEFLDFFVDGQPLRELLNVPAEMAKPEQETTALRNDWPHAAVEQLDRLMSVIPGDFSDGRVSLLLCPVCGDQACGAMTIDLTTTADTVTWRRFGWQDGITDEPQLWLFEEQTFTFDRTQYEELLNNLKERYQSLVSEEVSASRSSIFKRLFRRGDGSQQRT
ncbi:hypothetical protein [Arthrobacter sp. NPDC056493]|uniref:hypothetical protein n=1 Tax=Arthrobacter sp. NPDC056493 TaxID=3345839 RepID=UPI0036717407